MERFENQLRSLNAVQKSFIAAFQKTFLALTRSLTQSDVIKKEEHSELLKIFTESLGESYKNAISSLESTNPLSVQEKQQLKNYAEKAKRGERFNRQEAEDFYNLSKKLSEEKGSNEGVWVLLLLAAFILGLILGSRD